MPGSVERSGSLTWAQQEWFSWLPPDTLSSFEANQRFLLPGFGASPDQVVTAIRDLLLRHEGLRSLIERTGDGLRQRVCEVDDRLAEVITFTEEDPPGQALEAASKTAFQLGSQWPIMFVVFTARGRVRRVGLVLDHSAVDAWAMRVLCTDLALAIRSRTRGEEPFGDRVEQPLDAAEWEASPAGQDYQRRAREHWRARLLELRETLGGHRPRDRSAVVMSATPYHSCRLASGRLAQAADALARTARVPVSSVYLHAFGTGICAIEGSPAAGLFAFAANRLSAGAKASVRKTVMQSPVVVPSPDRGPYAQALTRSAAQQLNGHRFANLDPHASERLCAEVLGPHHRTGTAYARFNYIDDSVVGGLANGRSLDEEAIRFQDPAHQGRVTFREPRLDGSEYLLTVQHGAAGALLTLAWREDTGWGAHAEALLWHIESLMVWAAAGGAGDPPTLRGC